MSGYRRYPWGGVEVGCVLFGTKDSDTLHIHAFRPADCEHHYGPAFDLTEKDCETFANLLAASVADPVLAGLTPVGWCQSVSRRDLGLSNHARSLFDRFFPELWHFSMVLQLQA